jgi:hypothetical protein
MQIIVIEVRDRKSRKDDRCEQLDKERCLYFCLETNSDLWPLHQHECITKDARNKEA